MQVSGIVKMVIYQQAFTSSKSATEIQCEINSKFTIKTPN